MDRDEHFSTRGISGAQIMSGSGSFLIRNDIVNSRKIRLRLGDAVEMRSVIAGVEPRPYIVPFWPNRAQVIRIVSCSIWKRPASVNGNRKMSS